MSTISTHVLDTALGRPAPGVRVTLERLNDTAGIVGRGVTDADGRVRELISGCTVPPGEYRLRFDVASYFSVDDRAAFYPYVEIAFRVTDASAHYHVPLLISPFGYSTYRGS